MSKFLKVAAVLLLAFGALFAAGIFTLKKMFPPEKVKALITQNATEFLQREVRVGDVEIGILSGISVSDFAVSESHTFKSGTFLSSEKFVLKFQLLPLLRKKVVVDEITLQRPEIQVIQRADGKTFNFSDLMKTSTAAPKAAAPEKGEEAAPLSLTVSKANITDGRVTFIDQGPQKNTLTAQPINLSVTATGLDKPMSIAASVALNGVWGGRKVNGSFETKSVVEIPAQRVEVDHLSVKTDAAAIEAKGKVTSFMFKPHADITVTLKEIDFAKLSPWVSLPKELRVSGKPELTLHLKGSAENLETSLKLNLTQVALAYADAFEKSAGTEFTAEIKAKLFNRLDVQLDTFLFKLSAMETNLTGQINRATSDAPLLNLKLNAAPFELKGLAALSPQAAGFEPSGRIAMDLNIKGTAKKPLINGQVALENLGAKVQAFRIETVNGKINLTNDSVDMPSLTGKISGQGKAPADFKVAAGVKNFKNPDVTLNADFGALDLGMFLGDGRKAEQKSPADKSQGSQGTQSGGTGGSAQAQAQPEIKAQGKLHIARVTYTKFDGEKLEANWKLTGITPTLEKLNGVMEVEIGRGKIHNIPLLQVIAPFLKLDPSGGLVYSRIGGHWNIANGAARTDDFQVNSPSADVYAKGVVYLPKSTPDMVLTVKLPKGSVGGTLGQMTNDSDGRSTLTFKMKGDWKPSLDAAAVSKQATEEIKKKAGDVLQKEGQKLLEGLFKR